MEFQQKDLFVNSDDPEEEYRRRKDAVKKAISWGQRKLLLTVTQFLSYFLDLETTPNPIVVYAGAAPGINIKIISSLFPEVEWHLYDPAPFKIKSSDKIHVYRCCFTNKIAETWKGKDVYFISDIRTANYVKLKNLDKNEEEIIKDMKMQKKWVEIMKPLRSQLKFRPPYSGGNRPDKLRYFDGIIFKQCWAPQTSTETRLVVGQKPIYKNWDCRKYEYQLFHHNVKIRENYTYLNPFTGIESGVDEPELMTDWDSRCEVQIWMDYLSFRNVPVNEQSVVALSKLATAKLTEGRKFSDTLEYLRANPRAIKLRNFNPTRGKGEKVVT